MPHSLLSATQTTDFVTAPLTLRSSRIVLPHALRQVPCELAEVPLLREIMLTGRSLLLLPEKSKMLKPGIVVPAVQVLTVVTDRKGGSSVLLRGSFRARWQPNSSGSPAFVRDHYPESPLQDRGLARKKLLATIRNHCRSHEKLPGSLTWLETQLSLGALCDAGAHLLGLCEEQLRLLLGEVNVDRRIQELLEMLDHRAAPLSDFPPGFSSN